MGVQILNKDVSVVSSIIGKLKASIANVIGKTGWSGGTPASQGPLAGTPPATVNTSVPSGNSTWSNLANLFSATLSSSTTYIAGLYFNYRSYYIVGQGFGFSIPVGATINGIVVTLQSRAVDPTLSGNARDYSVKIVKNNIITGTDKSTLALINLSTFANRTYGSSTDLWGTTWTAADINNSNFGIAYSAELPTQAKNFVEVTVRNLRITVHYTP